MAPPRPSRKALLLRHEARLLRQEVEAWRGLMASEWPWMLALVFGLVVLVVFTRPLPPSEVHLAVGQAGSSFDRLGRKFVPYFAREGIRLDLVNTAGSEDSLAELATTDAVDAAVLVGGVTAKGSYPTLYSLGSVEYVPLWLFYRGPEIRPDSTPMEYFADRRVAVGAKGSATDVLLTRILALDDIALEGRDNFVHLPHVEAYDKLVAGEIDAMVLVDGFTSPLVQKLLARTDIHILDWDFAPAFVKKLPFLDTVVIPKGGIDLKRVFPPRDIRMLASSATILVDRTLHPAIQQLFLRATDQIEEEQDQFFAKPDFFPTYLDHSIELSPVAQRFYDQGAPPLGARLPFWLGSYIDRVWLLVVGALAVIYPLIKLFPAYRHLRSNLLIEEAYADLKEIDARSAEAETVHEQRELMHRLAQVEHEARAGWVASDDMARLFSLLGALVLVRTQVAHRLGALEAMPPLHNETAAPGGAAVETVSDGAGAPPGQRE